jgi:hypothetical protein
MGTTRTPQTRKAALHALKNATADDLHCSGCVLKVILAAVDPHASRRSPARTVEYRNEIHALVFLPSDAHRAWTDEDLVQVVLDAIEEHAENAAKSD